MAQIEAINQKLPKKPTTVFAFNAATGEPFGSEEEGGGRAAPEISVVIPVFNCEKYLPATLDMLLGQTIKNIEVLCINDGSTDRSREILEARAAEDTRLIVINQENQGQSSARNKGLDAARGRFIGFMDADDAVPLNYFEVLCRAAEEGNADMVHCRVNYTYPDGTVEEYSLNHAILRLDTRLPCNKLFFTYISGFIWNKVYRRELLKDLRFIEGIYWEDNPFTMAAALKARRILTVSDVYYDYLQRPNSTVHSIKPKIHFDLVKSTNFMLKYLNESPDVEKWMYRDFARHISGRLEAEIERAENNKGLAPAELKRFRRECFRTLLRIKHIPLSQKLGCEEEISRMRKHASAFARPFRIIEIPFRVIFNLFH